LAQVGVVLVAEDCWGRMLAGWAARRACGLTLTYATSAKWQGQLTSFELRMCGGRPGTKLASA
jgi:hypothetical protein